jgi:hypothetical protein
MKEEPKSGMSCSACGIPPLSWFMVLDEKNKEK